MLVLNYTQNDVDNLLQKKYMHSNKRKNLKITKNYTN